MQRQAHRPDVCSFFRGVGVPLCTDFFILRLFFGKDDLSVFCNRAGGDIFDAVFTYKVTFKYDSAVNVIITAESAGIFIEQIFLAVLSRSAG